MASLRSTGSEPSSRAITLRELNGRSVLVTLPVSFTLSGTGRKSRDDAAWVNAARSWPAARNSAVATLSVIHDSRCSDGSSGFSRRNDFSAPHELRTTVHAYP